MYRISLLIFKRYSVIDFSNHRVCEKIFDSQKRYFLSNAFKCDEAWNSRFKNLVFQKIDPEALYYDLAAQYNKCKSLNPVDVDLFVCSQKNDLLLTEVEEIIHKLRLSPDTHKTLPTTFHAVIRLFLNSEKKDDFLRILNDRLNYGIFPDNYCILYMLNKFILEQDFRSASKVASLQMIQEDFSHPLIRYLSLYSIYKYMLSGVPWDDVAEESTTPEEEDEEIIKIKVSSLRNPYFDDHFDLINGNHICGKTLVMISSHLNDAMGNSFRIIGQALYNKWEKLIKDIEHLISLQQSDIIYSESLQFTSNIFNNFESKYSEKITNLLKQLENKCCESSIITTLEEKINEIVPQIENNEIAIQEKLYKEWELLRDIRIKEYYDELNKQKRLQAVKEKTEELKLREELLYFFENEEKMDLIIEEKEAKIKKRTFPKTEKEKEEDYIPPEVQKRVIEE